MNPPLPFVTSHFCHLCILRAHLYLPINLGRGVPPSSCFKSPPPCLVYCSASWTEARLFTDREAIYRRINWYGGKLKPDYDGRTVIERAECTFLVDENALKNSAAEYKGEASYTIYFGNYQVRSLCADCLEYRKNMARDAVTSHAADAGTHQAAYGYKSSDADSEKYNEIFNAKFGNLSPLLKIHKALDHTQGRIPELK